MLDPKGLEAVATMVAGTTGCMIDAEDAAALVSAYLSTITPAEAGGLVEEYAADYDYRFDSAGGHTPTEGERAMLIDFGHGLIAAALEAQAAELAARPDWPTVNATYEKWKARAELAETALTTERAAHAETMRERDEARKALEQIAAIEPVSNCDAGSMARSRMRDIARYSIARRPK